MMWVLVRRREVQGGVRWPWRRRGVDGLSVKD
jgi:hypothetical protein